MEELLRVSASNPARYTEEEMTGRLDHVRKELV